MGIEDIEYKMSEKNPEMRETAARICRDYLHGVWKHITSENIVLKRISGGLSNWLYNVQLPEGTVPIRGEPRQVLLRLYGQVHGERALEGLITESVIFTLLSERKLGPKLHGVFPGGRIEEYIPARPLITKELADSTLSLLIAEKMGQTHMMQIPISKEPVWLWDTINNWFNTTTDILENIHNEDIDSRQLENINTIKCINFEHEINWLKTIITQQKYPVTFCHNDMQEGNILLLQNTRKPKLVLIDFEYCSYNYRGFDIANHFAEWQYDYTTPEYPFFHERPAAGPTKEQKLDFIRAYLRTLNKEGSLEAERILMEVRIFSLTSHLFWGLWSIVNAKLSQIPFGYWDYAVCRLKNYMYLKEKLLISGLPGSDNTLKRKSIDID
ncbi:PREDICTED: choline/ethanolamine kinase isoform X1 [Acromyrmex echinatior]|uniref:Choline/ethanolamine kinase n=2 Tax=Acromyrmex echinatior TaxID=103372 RepID=F4WLH3_ACREC|nr:PREDICTED: choline/ethanolamine kinase isoform X1 [Acromyrmex echinatior]EGI64909.1 Choline/ethanolamine kinase [Acromyrmex echinatior]